MIDTRRLLHQAATASSVSLESTQLSSSASPGGGESAASVRLRGGRWLCANTNMSAQAQAQHVRTPAQKAQRGCRRSLGRRRNLANSYQSRPHFSCTSLRANHTKQRLSTHLWGNAPGGRRGEFATRGKARRRKRSGLRKRCLLPRHKKKPRSPKPGRPSCSGSSPVAPCSAGFLPLHALRLLLSCPVFHSPR